MSQLKVREHLVDWGLTGPESSGPGNILLMPAQEALTDSHIFHSNDFFQAQLATSGNNQHFAVSEESMMIQKIKGTIFHIPWGCRMINLPNVELTFISKFFCCSRIRPYPSLQLSSTRVLHMLRKKLYIYTSDICSPHAISNPPCYRY